MSDERKYPGSYGPLSLNQIRALASRGDAWEPTWEPITVGALADEIFRLLDILKSRGLACSKCGTTDQGLIDGGMRIGGELRCVFCPRDL